MGPVVHDVVIGRLNGGEIDFKLSSSLHTINDLSTYLDGIDTEECIGLPDMLRCADIRLDVLLDPL